MDVHWLAPDSRRWDDFLSATPHDAYHRPGYVALSAAHDGGEPMALLVEEGDRRLFFPLILRPLPDGGHDAASPYGYPGPLASAAGQADEAFLCRAIETAAEALHRRGVVSLFLRLSPCMAFPRGPLQRCGTLVDHGETVYLDLTLPREELRRQLRPGHRYEIRRAQNGGAVVEVDASWREIDGFRAMYAATMRRVGAAGYYDFSREHFANLRAALGSAVHLIVARIEGQLAGGALFFEVHGVVQYHLSATADAYLRQCPAKLVLDFARDWFQSRGNRVLHLGGGVCSRNDSLFQFKAGFSRSRARFATWRRIVDPEAYTRLVRRWAERSGQTAAGPEGFFPAYRAPLSEQRSRVA